MIESITTDLVELRSLRESDRAEFIRMHCVSVDHFGPWIPRRVENLDAIFDDQLHRAESGLKGGPDIRLGAWLPNGQLAGLFSLGQIYRGPFLNAYAAWQVSAECIGRGIGTSGVLGLLDFAFLNEPDGLGLHRVQANIIPDNKPSVRVAEKAGFRLEGKAIQYLNINGEWRDHLMYAKLAAEHAFRFITR